MGLTDRLRFSPVLIVLDADGPLAAHIPGDVPVHSLNQPRVRKVMPKLVAILRRLRPAVIFSTFTHLNLPLLAARPLLGGARLVVREANLPSANLPRMPWPWAFRQGYGRLYGSA
ncbi:MAG: hypothetical protein EA406_03645, partial [Rhodospirillales bacterium]